MFIFCHMYESQDLNFLKIILQQVVAFFFKITFLSNFPDSVQISALYEAWMHRELKYHRPQKVEKETRNRAHSCSNMYFHTQMWRNYIFYWIQLKSTSFDLLSVGENNLATSSQLGIFQLKTIFWEIIQSI